MVLVINGLLNSCPLVDGNYFGFHRMVPDIIKIRLGPSTIWTSMVLRVV